MDKNEQDKNFKRGDVVLVDLGEQKENNIQSGVRPCVVVSNNVGNQYSDILIVVPLTSKKKKHLPTHTILNLNYKESICLCEQITTIAKKQVVKTLDKLYYDEMEELENALKCALRIY